MGPREVQAEIEAIHDVEPFESPLIMGSAPASWLSQNRMGIAALAGKKFADVCHAEWIAYLRRELELPLSEFLPKKKFDVSDVMSRDRRISQRVSACIQAVDGIDGIFYPSRHGSNLKNWALFEPLGLASTESQTISEDDPDFRRALSILDLVFDPAA